MSSRPAEPGSAQAALSRAQAALDLRRWERAIEEAQRAIALDPRLARAHALMCSAYLELKRYPEARREAEAALAIAPSEEWYHRLLSAALVGVQLPERALAASDEAVRLSPDLALAHYSRAQALKAMERKLDARMSMRRAVELDPASAMMHRGIGDLYLDDSPEIAEKHLRKALELDAIDPRTLNNLGVALQRQHRLAEAAIAYRRAIQIDPQMKVAKENTLETGRKLFRVSSIWIWLALVVTFPFVVAGAAILAGLFARAGAPERVVVMTALGSFGGGIAAVILGVMFGGRELKLLLFRARDPQLYALYKQLEDDRRRGHL